MTAWVLVLLLAGGPLRLAEFETMQECARNAQRITHRDHAERRAAVNGAMLDAPTYPGFVRAHCERIDR